jgi:L-threonylcarbamoyladenylate synthase
MIVLRVTKRNVKIAIAAAVKVLKRSGIIAYPTETTYGLGCDPRNAKAVRRIYAIKGREKKKPLLLVASSTQQVKKVAKIVGKNLTLANRFWPGPLTLVLPAKVGKKEVAIRISSSPLVQLLTGAHGFPIVSTSANKSGEEGCRSGRAIVAAFQNQKERPDLVIDVGSLPKRKASTIARVEEDGEVEVLRHGTVKI